MNPAEAAFERVTPSPAETGASEQSIAAAHLAQGAAPRVPTIAVALQVAAALLWVPQAALVSVAIANIAAGAGTSAALAPVLGILVFGIARAAIDRAGTRIAFEAARRLLSHLRTSATTAIAYRSPLDTARPSSGLAASALGEQAEAIVPYLARFQPMRLKVAIVPLAIAAVVFSLSWIAALVLLLAAPVIPIFMVLIGWQAKEASERQLVRMGDMNAFLLDRLRGLATIRTFGAVDRTAKQLRADAEALRSSTMAVLRIAFLSSAVLELFAALGVALVAVYVGFHFLGELPFGAWGEKLTLAQGLFILLLAPAFFEPLRDLSAAWHDRAAGQAGLEALRRLGETGTRIVGALEPQAGDVTPTGALSISVDSLRFAYPGREASVLTEFELAIEAGERVAIMAPSGRGKTTLLTLLAGLAAPTGGIIRIGGIPLGPATAAGLRAKIAWLGQPPHIFAGTLRGNIALGRPDVGADAVLRAAYTAGIDTLMAQRGGAPVGENGHGLSGGEALRVALARAAAGTQPGLILADEPTAHLDRMTADETTDRLLEVADGSTLVVATHDPVLAGRMDRIIVLPGETGGEAK